MIADSLNASPLTEVKYEDEIVMMFTSDMKDHVELIKEETGSLQNPSPASDLSSMKSCCRMPTSMRPALRSCGARAVETVRTKRRRADCVGRHVREMANSCVKRLSQKEGPRRLTRPERHDNAHPS
jgi:hypothetical protein